MELWYSQATTKLKKKKEVRGEKLTVSVREVEAAGTDPRSVAFLREWNIQ